MSATAIARAISLESLSTTAAGVLAGAQFHTKSESRILLRTLQQSPARSEAKPTVAAPGTSCFIHLTIIHEQLLARDFDVIKALPAGSG